MKVCTVCKQTKPVTDFHKLSQKRSNMGDGHTARCKECTKKYMQTPERLAADKINAAKSRKKPENIEKATERSRRYLQTERGKESHKKACHKYNQTERGHLLNAERNKKFMQTQAFKDAILRYRAKNPEKRKANSIIRTAIVYGKIHRPSHCTICNKQCVPEGHHPDYSKPLEVIWVCKKCHTHYHWSLR